MSALMLFRRASGVDGEEVTISGMLRDSQARNRFTPENHPEVNSGIGPILML